MIKTKIFTENKDERLLTVLMFDLSNVIPEIHKIKSITVEYEEYDWTEIYKEKVEYAELKFKLYSAGVPREKLEGKTLDELRTIKNEM